MNDDEAFERWTENVATVTESARTEALAKIVLAAPDYDDDLDGFCVAVSGILATLTGEVIASAIEQMPDGWRRVSP